MYDEVQIDKRQRKRRKILRYFHQEIRDQTEVDIYQNHSLNELPDSKVRPWLQEIERFREHMKKHQQGGAELADLCHNECQHLVRRLVHKIKLFGITNSIRCSQLMGLDKEGNLSGSNRWGKALMADMAKIEVEIRRNMFVMRKE